MLDQDNTGLILVDVQGKLARMMVNSERFIANTARLLQACRILKLPVIWLEQSPAKLGQTVPELSTLLPDCRAIEKQCFNACGSDEFIHALDRSDRRQWLVCGIEAHICVYQTALGLKQRQYEVEVVTDCVASRAQSSIDLALHKLAQRDIGLTNLEMCLYEMLGDAEHDSFNEMLALIKLA